MGQCYAPSYLGVAVRNMDLPDFSIPAGIAKMKVCGLETEWLVARESMNPILYLAPNIAKA